MNTKTFGLGLHISLDDVVFNRDAKNALIDHWNQCPAVVNNLYVTNPRLDEGIALASTWLRTYPQTRWILRLWPDDGNHAKNAFRDPAALYARNKPYHEMGFVAMLDNESAFGSSEGAAFYADWTARYLEMAGQNGHRAAWGRFAAGNIKEQYYPLFKTCLVVNSRYVDLHEYSPNEYFDSMADDSGNSVMERYRLMWNVATNGIKRPRTSIGEFGLARNYNPEAGFRGAGIPEANYIKQLGVKYRKHYQREGVPVSIYMFPEGVPPWDEMCISIGALAEIRKLAQEYPDTVVITIPENKPPALPGKDSDVWDDAQLLVDKCRVRSAPFLKTTAERTEGKILATVAVNTPLKVWQEPNYTEDEHEWFGVWVGDTIGWMALVRPEFGAQFKLLPTGPDPDVPPAEEPEPQYVTREEYADALLRLQAAESKIEAQAQYINEMAASIKAAVIMDLVMRLNTPPTNIVKLKETG